MPELRTSEEICEALVRHVEVSGSEVFEKNFEVGGVATCTVWCVIGHNAEAFRQAALAWLDANGFKREY